MSRSPEAHAGGVVLEEEQETASMVMLDEDEDQARSLLEKSSASTTADKGDIVLNLIYAIYYYCPVAYIWN